MPSRLPPWLKKPAHPTDVHPIRMLLRNKCLHSVCEEARCPNIGECFARKAATFMILGNTCTRNCRFCAVKHGKPTHVDSSEPARIAEAVSVLRLKHVVVTSVTRDDLKDGGASHFAKVIKSVKSTNPNCTIEVLTPDFNGNIDSIKIIADAQPDIFNHNVEVVPRLSRKIRDTRSSYLLSLKVLTMANNIMKGTLLKSGLMVGVGETDDEVLEVLEDLHKAGVNIVTIGQYLQPSKDAWPVVRYIHPDQFKVWRQKGYEMGLMVFAGPLVRSSYSAYEVMEMVKRAGLKRRNYGQELSS